MDPSRTPPPSRKPGLWSRMKGHILHPELTPEQVALSFALGFSVSWNPLLGLHTWICVVLCLCSRRLHRPLIFAAMLINNPWTMVPMATASTYLGNLVMGRGLHLDLSGISWEAIGWRSFASGEGLRGLLAMMKPILAPYLLGGFLLSALALAGGYAGMLWLARRMRAAQLSGLSLPLTRPEAEPPLGG